MTKIINYIPQTPNSKLLKGVWKINFTNDFKLPEINIECCTNGYHAQRGNNIPFVPALKDEFFIVTIESDEIYLFSGWLLGEKRYYDHHQHDEDK